MITSSQQLDAIKTLLPTQLSGYLTTKGWIEDGKLGEIAAIWHRKENEYHNFEILQPLTTDLKDYYQRVYDLIEVISEFEKREFIDIANDITNFYADIYKIKVIHDDVINGSIPFNDGVLLFEKAKELLSSVVRSTFHKQKYFSAGNLPEEIKEFMEGVRLGQTEYGSYVVNLIAPINQKDEAQKELSKVSVSRLVSETLSRSLSAIDDSIKAYMSTGSNTAFDNAIERGVSANLCDALIGITGKTKSRDVKITISLSKAEGELDSFKLEHQFSSNIVPYLQIASDYYKENYVLLDQTVSGLVTDLSYRQDDAVGNITIDAKINGVKKSIKIDLPIEEYWQSHSAHKKNQIVECVGDLHVSPRKAELVNVKEFRIISNDDLFTDDK